ncbi:sensor histidine kinase [Adlercreutzia equolifaciens]|uniref:sensor histidine kinase n=1 Tax=Adlercreutzia equolifaciens TaxID=446660 RepID=UPI0023AFF4F4|nr:ATP-binding protein [Adlercreutzia equolifaciens]
MRLSWKLFCNMVIVAALALSLGGYALIYSQFKMSLNREVEALLEEGDLLRYALVSESGTTASAGELTLAARQLAEATANQSLSFALTTAEGATLMTSPSFGAPATALASSLGSEERGWVLDERPGGTRMLAAATPVPTTGGDVFLETQRDVNELFHQRDEQFRLFASIEAAAVAVVGLTAGLLSLWITRPLRRLSTASRAMAQGNLEERVPVQGNDELSTLSQDFNDMADQVEAHVNALTAAAQRQEDFIGAFAHEIKTPLTSIIGYAELLLSRPDTSEEARESARYIFREGRRLEALSRKLMDLLVLESQNFERRPVAMDAFLGQVGGALEPALTASAVSLTVRAEHATVTLDPDLVEAACLNLIDNARKACEAAGPAAAPARGHRITVTGRCDGAAYVIAVTDSGAGIPEEDIDRITEAFYMVDKSRSRAQGGAGLGLAICQRIARLHGGSLSFTSLPGKGTTARLRLPLAPDTTAPVSKEARHGHR